MSTWDMSEEEKAANRLLTIAVHTHGARYVSESALACLGMEHPEQTMKDIMALLVGCAMFMQQHPEGVALAEKIATLVEGIDERKSKS